MPREPGVFDDSVVRLPCPACKFSNERSVGWIRSHDTFECDNCHATSLIQKRDVERPPTEVDQRVSGLRALLRARPPEPD